MENLSAQFGEFCLKKKITVATAESCTAGLISGTIAATPGSSAWLECGFTVYTPKAKNKMLGVRFETIERYDITSVEVAEEMALGALDNSDANLSLAVTGLAGPSGGTEEIPVGTVCMAWAFKPLHGNVNVYCEKKHFTGNRNEIRNAVVAHMLNKVMVGDVK